MQCGRVFLFFSQPSWVSQSVPDYSFCDSSGGSSNSSSSSSSSSGSESCPRSRPCCGTIPQQTACMYSTQHVCATAVVFTYFVHTHLRTLIPKPRGHDKTLRVGASAPSAACVLRARHIPVHTTRKSAPCRTAQTQQTLGRVLVLPSRLMITYQVHDDT